MYNVIQYSSNYFEAARNLWLYSNDEATNFNADIANTSNLKSFMYKAKLLENTEADENNGVLKNTTIAVPFEYLINFWRSLGIPLINCKVILKLKWTKYCVLSAACNDNANANPDNVIFTIKDTKLYVLVINLSARDNQKLSKLLSK